MAAALRGAIGNRTSTKPAAAHAAYLAYRRKYGEKALEMLQQEYGHNIPNRNPHFIMGTMKSHPQTFIIIGILRSGLNPAELNRQGGLF